MTRGLPRQDLGETRPVDDMAGRKLRAGKFDEEPGSGIAIQIEIEDAVGLKTQEEKLIKEIEESL